MKQEAIEQVLLDPKRDLEQVVDVVILVFDLLLLTGSGRSFCITQEITGHQLSYTELFPDFLYGHCRLLF